MKSKPVITYLAQYFKSSSGASAKTKQEKADIEKVTYVSAVGSVMYLMICTRPNLAHSVCHESIHVSLEKGILARHQVDDAIL